MLLLIILSGIFHYNRIENRNEQTQVMLTQFNKKIDKFKTKRKEVVVEANKSDNILLLFIQT